MFPPSTNPTPETAAHLLADGTQMDAWNIDPYNNASSSSAPNHNTGNTAQSAFANESGSSEGGLMSSDPNMMNTVGQTWLWDSFSPNVSW